MQLLSGASKTVGSRHRPVSSDECAAAVLEVSPSVVRLIRRLMLSHRFSGMSVPQFRTLALLHRSPKASLSCVANNIDASLPAASRMIGVLVGKKLVQRTECKDDRRQVSLALTTRGAEAFKAARELAQRHLAERLETLEPKERGIIVQGLELLGGLFGSDAKPLAAVDNQNKSPVSASGVSSGN